MIESATTLAESDRLARDPAPLREPLPGGTRGAAMGFITGLLPTIGVLALAGAVGWWGHHTGWKLPKFSELNGEQVKADDWCAEHGVAESECVECDPSLMPQPRSRGWCHLHGIPECTLCNPELAQLSQSASVTPSDLDRAKRSLDFSARPENNPICRTHHRRIQFASEHAADKAGIAVEPVRTGPVVEFIAAPGEIGYDQTRVAHMSVRSPGTVWKVFKHLGEPVKTGEIMALVDAAEVGKTKSEILQAFGLLQLRLLTQASIKSSSGSVPEAKVREVDAAVREAEIRLNAGCQALTNLGLPITDSVVRKLSAEQLKAKLSLLGIPTEAARTLDPRTTTTNLLPLLAPMDGVIVSRDVVAGEVVDIARILFEVVDIHSLWLTFDVKGEDARWLQRGQPVRFLPDGGRGEIPARLAWISTQADPKTRTIKARADLADPEGKLRANTFGSGRVILRDEPNVVVAPSDAIQWEGCCHVVFVRDKNYFKEGSPKVFHVRKVRIGAKNGDKIEIIAGLLPGEVVVTNGSGLLLTQLLRANLGEGCACHSKK